MKVINPLIKLPCIVHNEKEFDRVLEYHKKLGYKIIHAALTPSWVMDMPVKITVDCPHRKLLYWEYIEDHYGELRV